MKTRGIKVCFVVFVGRIPARSYCRIEKNGRLDPENYHNPLSGAVKVGKTVFLTGRSLQADG